MLYPTWLIIFTMCLIKFFIMLIVTLLCVAYCTHLERKTMGTVQRSQGPNVEGVFGLLQPLMDGFKLIIKEMILPSNSDMIMYLVTPALVFAMAIMGWAVMPFNVFASYININLALLYLLASSSLGMYGIMLSGWASNSKYSFLGALSSAAQMISYEMPMGLMILGVGLIAGSLNLNDMVLSQADCWYFRFMIGFCVILFICILAETNSHPFDLPEAEAELVSGYNTEYSAITFALFFLGEYANMLLMSVLIVILFFGGWLAPWETQDCLYNNLFIGGFWLGIKTIFIVILMSWMSVVLPSYSYDQLMNLGWKQLIPLIFGLLMLMYYILSFFNGLPPHCYFS